MSGERPDPNKPIDLTERRESGERVKLAKYFESAKNDLIDTFKEYGPPGWTRGYKIETQFDWGNRSSEGIMPEVIFKKNKGIRFVKPDLQGMVEFVDIAEGTMSGDSKGLEAYMGVAASKAFLGFSLEHNPDFDPSILSGVDARASLHHAISDSIYVDPIVTEESLFMMTDQMTDRIQANRAVFGLLFFSHPEKYQSMKSAFELNFEREATQLVVNRKMLDILVDTGQFTDSDISRWLSESFHEEWFAAAHPFSTDEVKYMFGQFESVT